MSPLTSHKVDFRILDRPDVPIARFAAGSEIIGLGSPASQMFLVKKGTAEIRIAGQPVEEVGPGGIFGEMGLIDRQPRSAAVVAKEDCEVIPIDERLFVVLVQDVPYFALDVMRVLVARIRAMNKQLRSG
jgi:CRP/FNR family transcriptional regulator, cyclic AMP receptor protein